MARGAVDWYAAGCPKLVAQTPRVMQTAKSAYVEENDPLGNFIAERRGSRFTPCLPSAWAEE